MIINKHKLTKKFIFYNVAKKTDYTTRWTYKKVEGSGGVGSLEFYSSELIS